MNNKIEEYIKIAIIKGNYTYNNIKIKDIVINGNEYTITDIFGYTYTGDYLRIILTDINFINTISDLLEENEYNNSQSGTGFDKDYFIEEQATEILSDNTFEKFLIRIINIIK